MKNFYRNKLVSEEKNRCIKKKGNLKLNSIQNLNIFNLKDIVYINLKDVCNYEISPLVVITHGEEKDIHIEIVEELINNLNINYKETKLYKYYKEYSPNNLAEVYKVKYSKNDILTKLSPHTIFKPWIHNYPVPIENYSHSGLFGPKSDSFIKNEYNRTKNVILSIKENGYSPNDFFDKRNGLITFQLYKYNDKYKIYVIAGNHRTAVLKAMGQFIVPAIFQQNQFLKPRNKLNNMIYNSNKSYQKIIDYSNIDNWPGVKSGFISKSEASKMFLSFFAN